MKQHTVRIGKKEFPLVFTLGTMELLEEQIKDFDLSRFQEIMGTTKGLLDILYCLAQEGAIYNGTELKEDRKWFGAHCPVAKEKMIELHTVIAETLVDGMTMETDEDDPDQEVDVVLEELKKRRKGRLTHRQTMAYGLIAGLRPDDMRWMPPGLVLDLFIYRRQYDDTMHRITRHKEKIYD